MQEDSLSVPLGPSHHYLPSFSSSTSFTTGLASLSVIVNAMLVQSFMVPANGPTTTTELRGLWIHARAFALRGITQGRAFLGISLPASLRSPAVVSSTSTGDLSSGHVPRPARRPACGSGISAQGDKRTAAACARRKQQASGPAASSCAHDARKRIRIQIPGRAGRRRRNQDPTINLFQQTHGIDAG